MAGTSSRSIRSAAKAASRWPRRAAEIAAKLTADKRKEALTDLVTKVEDAIADGSNFAEAAALAKLTVIETPLITAGGTARGNPGFHLPAELAPALQSGFELDPG